MDVRDLTIVIRTAGERTAEGVARVIRAEVASAGGDASAQVHVVRAKPFVEAVRETMRLGIDGRRAWTIGIDADLFLLPDGLRRMVGACEEAKETTFSITPLVLCKFFGGFCFRGVHAYRSALLPTSLAMIDRCGSAGALRPEATVVHAMEAAGNGFEAPTVVVGVHDYEQSFAHIYLKMRLRARRELSDENGRGFGPLVRMTAARAGHDTDYLVAAWGLQDGLADMMNGCEGHYDWDAEYPELQSRMRAAGLRDKSPLEINAAATLASSAIIGHDISHDERTPKWIREKLGFSEGREAVVARLGLVRAPGETKALTATNVGHDAHMRKAS